MEIYTRNCPKCNEVLETKNKYWNIRANREGRVCVTCANRNKVMTDEWKENLHGNHADFSGKNNPFYGKLHTETAKKMQSVANAGKDRFSDKYKTILREKMRGDKNPFFGKHHSLNTLNKLSVPKTEAHKQKLKLALKGNTSSMKGRHHTDESKRKMRVAAIGRISRMKFDGEPMYPNVNPRETTFFKQMEVERGWNGIFYGKNNKREQFLIKHLGYFVDYYEPSLNIVIEYDETNHYNSDWSLKEKDICRQEEITNYLRCKFFRYNELLDEMCEFV